MFGSPIRYLLSLCVVLALVTGRSVITAPVRRKSLADVTPPGEWA